MHYDVLREGEVLRTQGLVARGLPEVSVTLRVSDNENVAGDLLRMIADYMLNTSQPIRTGEKFEYGSWTLQLEEDPAGVLRVLEYLAEKDTYVDGASFSMGLWDRQQRVCRDANVACHRPKPTQLVVVSDGVLEGEVVEGVRYPSPAHMSGWWITSDKYNNDPKTLKSVHLMHVLRGRPEIGDLLGLPFGFRFSKEKTVCFDKDVAEDVGAV